MKNKNHLSSYLLLLVLTSFTSFNANSQAAKSSDYPLNPSWVQMMSDPNVNYYVAVKAYDDFWKGKEKPNNEAEEMEMRTAKNHSDKMMDKEKKQLEQYWLGYRYHW